MKPINRYLSNKIQPFSIKATDENIRQIVQDELDRLGHDADLNHIDVSRVTNMNSVFCCSNIDLGPKYADLNPDISNWNVRNVKNMTAMFYECKNFNQDLSQWDVNNVTHRQETFCRCENFNQDISGWNVRNVINMRYMFSECKNFNQDLSRWNVNKVIYNDYMFDDCPIKEEYKPHFVN